MMSPKVRVAKKEVTIEPEKIKLIKVLIEAEILDITELPCRITCDEENGKVVVAGDCDFIDDVATSMQQLVSEMANCKVSQGNGFLCTAHGEKWIKEEFEKRDIPAIIYTKNQVTYVLAKDELWLESGTRSLDEVVTRQMIDLDEPILPFLKTSEWNNTVEDFPRNYMVQVISDLEFARILVSGRRDDVNCVIGYIDQLISKMSPPDETSVPPNVILVRGDIATFEQADVLVNTIAANANSLMGAGSVSESFLEAGGEKLQKEFEKSGAPVEFGTDVTVTGTTGTIQAKKIFHVAIERMQNARSLELLTSLIKTCLKKAEEEKLSSIAFPTLGCGYLKYNQPDVSRCFAEAAKGSRLKIYIVACTQDLYEEFKNDFRAQELTATAKIVHAAIAQLDDEVAANIQSYFEMPDVEVATDKSKSTITLAGAKDAVDVAKQIILKALADAEILQKTPSFVKEHWGVKEYLIALSSMPIGLREIPEYWKICGGQVAKDEPHATNSIVSKRLLLVKSSPVYNAVESLVKGTWDLTRGGALSGINVTNIWIVVNQNLFRNYQTKLKLFASRAADGSFKAITDLGQSEIITKTVKGSNFICEQLVSEVNEVYLCHGTTHVNEIEKTGIDSRLFRDSGLYGRGAYFAESSTKSNQYAKSTLNPKAKRYMFVARVLLGEPFLCKKTDDEMKRAPCMSGCKDSKGQYNCTADHSMCDSVFGTAVDFREFVVYSPEQSYPEFLVEYVRQ